VSARDQCDRAPTICLPAEREDPYGQTNLTGFPPRFMAMSQPPCGQPQLRALRCSRRSAGAYQRALLGFEKRSILRISSRLAPVASRASTSLTRILKPRKQRRSPHRLGSTDTSSVWFKRAILDERSVWSGVAILRYLRVDAAFLVFSCRGTWRSSTARAAAERGTKLRSSGAPVSKYRRIALASAAFRNSLRR
jgi:hypothetical protein